MSNIFQVFFSLGSIFCGLKVKCPIFTSTSTMVFPISVNSPDPQRRRVEEGLCRGDAPNGAHALHGLPRLDPQLEDDLLRHGESIGDNVYVENHG